MLSHLVVDLLLAAPPNPGDGVAPPGADKIIKLLQWAAWIVFAACVGGVLLSAGLMAVKHRRGEGGEAATGLAWVLTACVIGGSASALVAAFM